MKSFVFAAVMMMSAVSMAKSVCMVAEKSTPGGSYDRLLAVKDIEPNGESVILHQAKGVIAFAAISAEGTLIGFYNEATGQVAQAARGLGTEMIFLNVEKNLAVICRQQ